MRYPRIASFKTPQAFKAYLEQHHLELPFEEPVQAAPESPLAQPLTIAGSTLANRFCALPMEGWDGTLDGRPTELTSRRWQRFGESGAALIWGGEAVAVRQDGRANPNQLLISPATLDDLRALRQALVDSHQAAFGSVSGLAVGLQLTHSGRYSRPDPDGKPQPWLAYDHPWLNRRLGLPIPSGRVLSDAQVERLIADFIAAAALAWKAGFDFVDIKHCHGYLLHEFLSAFERPGKYGGDFANRTRLAREIIQGIQAAAPGLKIAVRLSAFDFQPFIPGVDQVGQPEAHPDYPAGYPYAFGGDGSGCGIDLTEPVQFIRLLNSLGVRLICVTAGSPYYVPHIQRPALFPPSDGYLPPEDPLAGVARQLQVARQLKEACPDAVIVASALTYLQEWLPNVAQAALRQGWFDCVGLGRMMLAYPQMPADILAGRPLQRKKICRTFSDCTTAPRRGLVSGCYPLDEFYRSRPESDVLARLKRG